MKVKHIIFDLDGTLWDSRTTLIHSWNKVLLKHKLIKEPLVETDLNQFMGLLLEDILPTLFPEMTQQQAAIFLSEIMADEAISLREMGGILYDQVPEVLKELAQNCKLYIVSNCQDGYIEAFLDFTQLHDLFVDFESAGRTNLNKQQNIKLVLERNQIPTNEAIYVGDTLTDYLSATENDLCFIFCEYGFGELLETSKPYKSIAKFKELLCLI